MTLIDSNLIIYAVQAEYKDLRRWIIDIEPSYSIVSRVEVLGFVRLQTTEKQAITELLDSIICIQIIILINNRDNALCLKA